MPKLTVNGQTRSYTAGAFPKTLADLILALDLDEKAVLAEVDGMVVPHQQFDTFELKGGQAVELVQFVGGG